MKRKHSILIVILIVLVVSNMSGVSYFFKDGYAYSNYNGDFRWDEAGGKGGFSYEGIVERYEEYKTKHQQKDTTLYRTFTLKPWHFWEWGEWIISFDRFTLPYISEEQIKANQLKDK